MQPSGRGARHAPQGTGWGKPPASPAGPQTAAAASGGGAAAAQQQKQHQLRQQQQMYAAALEHQMKHQQQHQQQQQQYKQHQQAQQQHLAFANAGGGSGSMGAGTVGTVQQQQQYMSSPKLVGLSKHGPMSPQQMSPYARVGMPPPMSPMIDPMDDGDDDEDLLPPEEEVLVVPREFGRTDRLNKDAKRERLLELNSPFPTRNEMQAVLDGLQQATGKGLLQMACFLHDQLEELVAVEQKEKVTKLRFSLKGDEDEEEDQLQANDAHPFTFKDTASSLRQGPRSTIGVLLADRPEALGMPGRCVVHGSVPGSPAYFSGKIRQGDVIMQVDEQSVSPDNVVSMMCGNDVPGTRIKLLVDRATRKRPFAVHLIRAEADAVAHQKGIFEMLASLAEAAGTGQLDQNPHLDNSNTALHREMVEAMKLLQREKTEDELILREQLERKDRALVKAQILIREFVAKSRQFLSEADLHLPLPLGPNTNEPQIATSEKAGISQDDLTPARCIGSILSIGEGSEDTERDKLIVGETQDGAQQMLGASETSNDSTALGNGKMEDEVLQLRADLEAAHDHTTLLTLEQEMLTQKLEISRNENKGQVHLAEQLKKANVKCQELLQEQAILQQQLEQVKSKCNELSKANDALTSSLDEAGVTLLELRSEIAEKTDVIDSLHKCRSFQDEARSASDTRCSVLQDRCDALEERCDMLSVQREELLTTVSNAENDAASALRLLDDEKALYAEAQSALKDLNETLDKKEEELLWQASRIEELTAQQAKWAEDAGEKHEHMGKTETNSLQAEEVLAEARNQNRELENALQEALQRYEELNQDHSAAILEHDVLLSQYTAELRQAQGLKKQIAELEAQLVAQGQNRDAHIPAEAVMEHVATPRGASRVTNTTKPLLQSQPTASPSGSAKPQRATPTPMMAAAGGPPTLRPQARQAQMTSANGLRPQGGQPVPMAPFYQYPGGMRR